MEGDEGAWDTEDSPMDEEDEASAPASPAAPVVPTALALSGHWSH